MENRFENNLSQGSVLGKLFSFAWPFLISNLIQSMYNVADMLIVGQFADTAAMSGVNIGGQITMILTNITIGLCNGGTVLISQYVGANQKEKLKRVVSTLITTLLFTAVLLTVLMLAFKTPLLQLIRTPAESFGHSSDYLTITTLGLIFIFGYNALSAILRGMGDSFRPFLFVLVACITNIVLDLVLVAGMGLSAYGAALATVVSQGLSMILCVLYMVRNRFVFDFKPSSFRIDRQQMGLILRLGLPTAIQNGVTSLSFLGITMMVNSLGYQASAAVGAVSRLNSFAIMPAVAMSASISTMAAQNIGAKRWDRAIHTCRLGTGIAFGISLVIFALVQVFPRQIIGLFNSDPAMLDAGVAYIRTFSIDYLVVPFVFCINGLFVGGGHTMFSLINNMLSAALLRLPISWVFGMALDWGLLGLGLGAPTASLGSLLLIIAFLISGKWRVNKVADRVHAPAE